MPQVNVTIAGKTYRMACGEGEEAHLEGLAQAFDAKVREMREAFGEIGDMRLHVMATLTLCDELEEARARAAALEDELTAARARAETEAAAREAGRAQVSDTVSRAAERIERLARALG
jgi:cell division protein ZapA